MADKDPARRYPTPVALANDLKRFACGPDSPSLLALLEPPSATGAPISDRNPVFDLETAMVAPPPVKKPGAATSPSPHGPAGSSPPPDIVLLGAPPESR